MTTTEGPSKASLGLLRLLQGRKVYEGTVPHADVQKRRARGKVAKASRKLNRGQK